jgi:sugar phosphate isomerase/epimerase
LKQPSAYPFSLNTFNESPWIGGSGDLPGWVEAAAAAGFDQIGPDCASLEAWLAAGGALPALARQMRDAGVGCAVVAACAVLDGSPTQRDALRRAAGHAEALGARMLQVNVAAPDAPARLAAVADAASLLEGTGLKLALEYMPFTPLRTLGETLEIVAQVGPARAGALIDIWHHAHDPGGWEALATAPLDAIAYVEFDDARPIPPGADLSDETLHHRAMPGTGALDCARFAGAVRAIGYTGMVSIEVLDRGWRGRPLPDYARACHAASAPYWV